MSVSRLLPLAAVVVLVGAGCASAPPATPADTTPPDSSQTQEQPGSVTNGAGGTGTDGTLPTAETDDTWTTYENAGLGFSFLTPTRGLYVPRWEMQAYRLDDPAVADCVAVEGAPSGAVRRVETADGQEFCHVSASEGAAGSVYFTDAYRTDIGQTAVVLRFTKRAVMADIGECERAPGQALWSEFATPESCTPFSEAEYAAMLDGIVSTFARK